ncbi:MAG: methyltransferase domain-containing protein [Holosporaceae bacterium]|jgi:malonyl-ACP O-methyltransferase BioC|nr:methyltransferase domain-containing protein [Holosporaceae bacterium]
MKEKIKSSFDSASETYDSVSEVQTLSSAHLVEMLKKSTLPLKIAKILDIGSGTGNTSLELMKVYPAAVYTLCDISENMIRRSRMKIKSANYIVGDAERYNFTEKYHLAVSNLTMQWFESVDLFLEKILKNCEYFAFSTLLDESFYDYENLLRQYGVSVSCYPSIDEIIRICQKRGQLMEYEVKRYDLLFDTPFGLVRYFKKLGAGARQYKGNVVSLLRGHKIKLNYCVFFAIIKGNNGKL